MTDNYSFFVKVTEFFEEYLKISGGYEQNGILSRERMQDCANYLIGAGVFKDKNDMKEEAANSFNIILPDWIFRDVKE